MKLDGRTLALVAAIRAEANATITPSQYDRLQAIADHLKELEAAIRKDEEAKVALYMAVEAVRTFRVQLRAQVMEKRERWMDEDGDEAAGRRMTYNEVLDLLDGESFSEVSPGPDTTTGLETPWEAS